MAAHPVLQTIFDAFVEARTRQAAAYIRGPLAIIDPQDRVRAGYAETPKAR